MEAVVLHASHESFRSMDRILRLWIEYFSIEKDYYYLGPVFV